RRHGHQRRGSGGWRGHDRRRRLPSLWTDGVMSDLAPLSVGSVQSVNDINATGQVALTWFNFPMQSAHLWTPTVPNGSTGTFTYLGVLPYDDGSAAHGMNDAGDVVGYSTKYV